LPFTLFLGKARERKEEKKKKKPHSPPGKKEEEEYRDPLDDDCDALPGQERKKGRKKKPTKCSWEIKGILIHGICRRANGELDLLGKGKKREKEEEKKTHESDGR